MTGRPFAERWPVDHPITDRCHCGVVFDAGRGHDCALQEQGAGGSLAWIALCGALVVLGAVWIFT